MHVYSGDKSNLIKNLTIFQEFKVVQMDQKTTVLVTLNVCWTKEIVRETVTVEWAWDVKLAKAKTFMGVLTHQVWFTFAFFQMDKSKFQIFCCRYLNLSYALGLFVCALDYSSDGSSLRDITSSPREVCSRVCNRTSRLATFQTGLTLPGRWYCLGIWEGSYGQFNPNTTITAVI